VYSARAMTLPDYSCGRVLFTGDAAHLLPIFGVRGANTGWQDCHNLAWKLAFVLRGWSEPALLRSYSQERVTAAREIIAEAGKSTRFMTPPHRGYRLLRDATLSLSLSEAFVRPLFHWRTSRAHDYLVSDLNCLSDDNAAFGAGPVNGAPAQNIRLGENDYLFDHLGASFYLFYFSQDGEVPAALTLMEESIRAREVPFALVHISGSGRSSHQGLVIDDRHGHMAMRYGATHGTGYLVRPDQHICGRWKAVDSGDLLTALQRAMGNESWEVTA